MLFFSRSNQLKIRKAGSMARRSRHIHHKLSFVLKTSPQSHSFDLDWQKLCVLFNYPNA
ncbi:MAG: hypothetical protein J7647_02415 [Cyanobacteria bacterium SBLK]|nr:hypothetical protein [Cyanobacteria bacterium SBLK]